MTDIDFIEVRTRIRRKRVLKMAYNRTPIDKTKIAAIRFSGTYLEDLGFVVDGKYELTVNPDSTITLKPLPPEDESVAEEDESVAEPEYMQDVESES